MGAEIQRILSEELLHRVRDPRVAHVTITRVRMNDDLRLALHHASEATYGDPAYGGNRDGGGWVRIGFPEPLHPPLREVQPS